MSTYPPTDRLTDRPTSNAPPSSLPVSFPSDVRCQRPPRAAGWLPRPPLPHPQRRRRRGFRSVGGLLCRQGVWINRQRQRQRGRARGGGRACKKGGRGMHGPPPLMDRPHHSTPVRPLPTPRTAPARSRPPLTFISSPTPTPPPIHENNQFGLFSYALNPFDFLGLLLVLGGLELYHWQPEPGMGSGAVER